MAYPFATSGALGANFTQVDSPQTDLYPYQQETQFALGQQVTASDNSVWVYCVVGSGGFTGAGYVATIDEDFVAAMITTALSVYGHKVGVAAAASSEDDNQWFQIYGACQAIRVEQDALGDAKLAATSDPGQLDDAGSTGLYVRGIVINTARGGTDGNVAGQLNWPVVDTIPAAG